MDRISRARRAPGTYRPTGRRSTPTACSRHAQDSKAETAAKRRLSRRARFSAATRTYLTSVPDPPGYKVSLFCEIEGVACAHTL